MAQIEKFLEKVAKHLLLNEGHDMKDVAVVFPNKRPLLFLKKYLMSNARHMLWMPVMMSIDDFVQQATGLAFEDPLRIYFYLYDIHKKLNPGKAVSPDEFFNWAPLLLRDFNDVDNALADPEELYAFLTDTKALELWNTDGSPLTEIQKNYLDFFRKQKEYYNSLKTLLLRKGTGYQGMVYRYLAENIDNLIDKMPWRKFRFAGFNALTAAEQRIMDSVKHHADFAFFADSDSFYLTPRRNKIPEAGVFLNSLKKKWNTGRLTWEENLLLTDKKKIDVVPVALSVGQVLYAGEVIKRWLSEGVEPMEIAVVPADESLLMPLLNALPEKNPATGEKIKYNITLGYSLNQSPLLFFAERWLELLKLRQEEPNGRYFVPVLLQWLTGAFGKIITGEKGETLQKRLVAENRVMLPADMLLRYAAEAGFEQDTGNLLFAEIAPHEFPEKLLQVLQRSEQLFNVENETGADILWKHQLYLLAGQSKYLSELIKEIKGEVTWRTLQRLLPVLFHRSRINLRGEPLEGVQIMGVLETRSLDFSRLIVLGMNEGIFPSLSFTDTLISMDIRNKFGLALPQQSTAVYAYHFFRLLQRAREAVFLYNAEPGNLGGGEKSRFLLQLKDELLPANENITYNELPLESKITAAPENQAIVIRKDRAVLEKLNKLAAKGFSPSAINSFVLCPLQFYFDKIAEIKEETALETSVEANTFGSVVHGVLERLYAPFIGRTVDTEALSEDLKNADVYLKEAFRKEYKMSDLAEGENHLIYQVAKSYVERFVRQDIGQLIEAPRKIIYLEKELYSDFSFGGKTIRIKGIIDRVDATPGENEIRIIDYKTGRVEPRELTVKKEEEMEGLFRDSKRSKALQVLLYTWLFNKNFPWVTGRLKPGIISLRSLSRGFMEVSLPEDDAGYMLSAAEESLRHVFENLFDENIPFEQQQNEDKCAWCAFKEICNR